VVSADQRIRPRHPWLHPVVIEYAEHGMVVFVGLLMVGWWIARRSHGLNLLAAAMWAPLGALAAVAINQPIVSMVAEARPHTVLPDIVVLTHRGSDPSFPSDYAVLAGAVVAGLWLVSHRLGVAAVLAAAAITFAGVYIGADYIDDVLAGLAMGATVSALGFWATRPVLVWVLGQAEHSPLVRPLLMAADTSESSR
jgi:membrane-associated phospholipid phosphatase